MQHFLKIRSRNQTAKQLRLEVPTTHKYAVLRLGSKTPTSEIFPNVPEEEVIQINTAEACMKSNNKVTMKQAFDEAKVRTAKWWILTEDFTYNKFPLIIKHRHSSKGVGIYLIQNIAQLHEFIKIRRTGIQNQKYIVEKYYTYNKEYRLHVTKEGCFYSCRKMLRDGAIERWHRHDANSVWVLETNPMFDKPSNWDAIIEECVKAMNACGLDICAVDVKVQSSDKEEPKFIILETNSAPALGEITTIRYIEQLTKLLKK